MLIDITPQLLKKFTDEEVRKIEQLGYSNSNIGSIPCMNYFDKYNIDICIYKSHTQYIIDVVDQQSFKKKQIVYNTFSELLKKLKKNTF